MRYADDANIYVRRRRSGERVMAGVERFLRQRLKLTLNREKSRVAGSWMCDYLGYGMSWHQQPRLSIGYVEIGDVLRRSLEFNNNVKNLDGFFTGVVERCWINSGIHGTYMGDSLTIQHNTITGRNCGIEVIGLSGAQQMAIHDNNITTNGGALALINVEQPQITINQLEHPGYSSRYTGIYDPFIHLSGCFKPYLHRNTINPDNRSGDYANSVLPSSTITTDNGTTKTVLSGNDMNKARLYHVNSGVTGAVVYLDKYQTYYNEAALASTGTVVAEALAG